MRAFFEVYTPSMRFNGGPGPGVDAGLLYSEFVPCRPQLHPTLPGMWICGYWFGVNGCTGNGDGGPITISLSPLPNGPKLPWLPTEDAYWQILGISVYESLLPVDFNLTIYSDEYGGGPGKLVFFNKFRDERLSPQIYHGLYRRCQDVHQLGVGSIKVCPVHEAAPNDINIYDGATGQILTYIIFDASPAGPESLNQLRQGYALNANGIILKPEAQLIKEGLLDNISPLRVKRA